MAVYKPIKLLVSWIRISMTLEVFLNLHSVCIVYASLRKPLMSWICVYNIQLMTICKFMKTSIDMDIRLQHLVDGCMQPYKSLKYHG